MPRPMYFFAIETTRRKFALVSSSRPRQPSCTTAPSRPRSLPSAGFSGSQPPARSQSSPAAPTYFPDCTYASDAGQAISSRDQTKSLLSTGLSRLFRSPELTAWKAKSTSSCVFAAVLRLLGSLNTFTRLFATSKFFCNVSPPGMVAASRAALSKPVILHSPSFCFFT